MTRVHSWPIAFTFASRVTGVWLRTPSAQLARVVAADGAGGVLPMAVAVQTRRLDGPYPAAGSSHQVAIRQAGLDHSVKAGS
jgi:hypothetical protein